MNDLLVIALGGNAIARPNDDGSIESQYRRAEEAMRHVADLVCDGRRIVLTHGNGPVVGNIVLRGELAAGSVPPMPLFISGADSEGGIGLMLQQTLGNELLRRNCSRPVASIITQVVVDPADAAFSSPSKPIGRRYSEEAAKALARDEGWSVARQSDGRWQRVVASPRPVRVVESAVVEAALNAGVVPIAGGGGGVPVREHEDGTLSGVDAVIDKDWTSSLLAVDLSARHLIVLMEADAVYLDWGRPDQRALQELSVEEGRKLIASGTLAEGTILPKIEASMHFVSSTGRPAILCSTEQLCEALDGKAGTRIVP